MPRPSSPTDFAATDPPWRVVFHLETAANLLELLERLFSLFSKRVLKSLDNQADFDSAIRRFDPSMVSHPALQPKIDYTIIAESPQNKGFLTLIARSTDSE